MRAYEIYRTIDGQTVMTIYADTTVVSTKVDQPGIVFIGDTNMGLVFMNASPEYGVREKV